MSDDAEALARIERALAALRTEQTAVAQGLVHQAQGLVHLAAAVAQCMEILERLVAEVTTEVDVSPLKRIMALLDEINDKQDQQLSIMRGAPRSMTAPT